MLLLFGYLVICVGLVFGDQETFQIGGYYIDIDNHILQPLDQISNPSDNLDLSGRQLNGIKWNAFIGWNNLKTLKLDHNNLSNALPDSVFQTLENLRDLSLAYNSLSSVNSLGLLPNSLTSLVLRDNKIVLLDRSIFNNLNNLIALDLSNNEITRLEKGVFNGLANLFELDLSNNQITAISHDSWQGLSANLKFLYLRNNNIEKLEKGTFADGIPSFRLYISENQITEIESETFNSGINVLNLTANLLDTLEPESFKGMSNLRWLFIKGNSIKVVKLEVCGRLFSCVQRLCSGNSTIEEGAEPRQSRGRRGAQDLEGRTSPEDGILPVPVSPSPASTSSQEDSCKPPPRNCYRLVVLGTARVGKTAIVARFLSNKFEESYTPTIEDFHRKLYRIRGEVHQLDLLDTSGNHPFPAMRRLSFLTGDLFVLVFSMDCRESFEETIRLREAILESKVSATQGKSRKSHHNLKVPMVIVGNKCDRETKSVTVEEAQQYCATQDDCCVFVEVSAKRNYHVDELFYQLFVVAGLPLEMAPNLHRKVPLTFGSPTMLPPSQPKHKATLSIKRRLSDACGVVAPNVRRPSIRTDLMIMRTKTCSMAAGNENNTPGSRITLRSTETGKTCSIQ